MINLLPQDVVNQIAAGEVVERPASVLKEILENSIDAGSSEIKVFIEEFGTKKIQVIDNGSGIEKDDFEKIFLKHATSKIKNIEDLNKLYSYGFRGEALASISSVSKVILETKHGNDEIGSEIIFENGKINSIKPSSIAQGTNIQILDLFENIPARKKFLKSKATENKTLVETFNKFAIANPQINFSITIDGSIKNYPEATLKERISKIYKLNEEDLIPVLYDGVIKLTGFAVHPRVFLKNKSYQTIFVNKRIVTDGTISKAVFDGYDTFLMKNQYSGFVVFVDLPPSQVDVNVHPRKTEVRFISGSEVYRIVRLGVNSNLVRHLREETQKKLEVITENQKNTSWLSHKEIYEPTNNIEKEPTTTAPEVKEMVLEAEVKFDNSNNLATEFEAFLSDSKAESNSNDKSSKIKSFFTEKALLFNQEIISEEEKDIKHKINLDLANATQLLNSYILTSNESSILIIDQHAASERFFYEKYLSSINNKSINSRLLLFPEIVSLDEHDIKILEENKKVFEELGFDFETFGDEEIKFTKVPEFVKMDNFRSLLERIIKDILENEEITNVKDKIYHEIAAILACHTAVRFGDKLTKEEIIKILNNLTTCEDPYNCPHGRPVIQDLSKYDIEKKFKRCGL